MSEELPLPEIEIPDLNLPSLIDMQDGVLNTKDIPEKAMIILALRAIGFGCPRIANIMKCSKQAIFEYCKRYDPNGLCKVTPEAKRVLTTEMLHSTSIAALMEITQEKLRESDAKDLAGIAARCASTAEKLSLTKKIVDKMTATRVTSMLDSLDIAEEV